MSESELQYDLPASRPAPRPRLDARTTAWLISQRERVHELELEAARLRGELELSSRVERGVQRFCDRLEDELKGARQREATLARALGYAEAERDQMRARRAAPAEEPRKRLGGRRRR